MLSGHDGGISLTTDNTATNAGTFPVAWTSLNNGYYTTQAYAIGIDPETSGDARIIAGFQDNGKYTTTSTSGTASWFEEGGGGDGTYVAIVAGEDIRYVGTQNGSVRRYKGPNVESPLTFDYINPISASGELFVNPYILDQNDQNIMYHAGGNFVWRNTNLEGVINKTNFSGSLTNWEVITGTFAGGNSITALDVSKYDKANVLYYGTSGGDLFRYDDANTVLTTAVNITDASFPSGAYVSCVAVDPYNSANVIVVFSNYQVKSVFYSNDSGASWTDISGNLEQNADGSGNGPSVRWAEIHRDANGLPVYLVGTSTGLYSTETLNGTSTTWTQEGSTTIGNVPVTMIVGRSIDNLVAVGTHGVGIFSASVTASSPTCNGAINLAASNITETTVTLSWTAVGGATSYDVRYQVRGSGVWTNVNGITATSTNLTGLTTNTNYQFQVRVNCGAGTGEYVSSFFSSKLACTTTFPYLESFESDFGNWTQDKTDDFEWDLNNTGTFTSATGPSGANDGSVYAFIESSGTNNPTKTARLVSNCFDLSGLSEPKFSFDYHMYGNDMGTLSLEVSTDNGSSWTSIWSQTGDQGDTWFSQELDISAYQTSSTQFRFVGVTGGGFRSDMAIDKVQIYATPSAEKGNYLSLDGTNQYVSTGSNLSTATDNFTMELWFQRSGSGSGDRILFYNGSTAANNGYGLVLDNSNYVVPMIDGNPVTNTTTLIDANKWYHAALVRESGTLKLYINGLEQTLGSSSTPTTPTVATYLGGNNGGGNAFSGFLEEARFWSVARTLAQVRENMHLVVEGTTSGLVTYYQFNETQMGVDANDAAGGNNGTLQNAPTRVSSDCPIGKGRSETISVTTGGVKDFSTTGLQLEFPGSGTYPNGNLVVTQIDGIGAPTNIPSDVKTYPSSYWVIHNYGTNATFTELLGVTITLPNNDVISANDEATPVNIKIYKRSSSAGNSENWTEIGSAASATAATRTLVFNTFTPDFDSFSQLMAGATNTATSGLPVTLSRFEALRLNETQVLLNWETISEINSLNSQILKSDNGVDFSIIGEQDAAGNSTQTKQYAFVDTDALRSAYYRLKQIDQNGTYTLSNIKFVEGKDLQSVQFFPNPFANELKIDFGSTPTTLPIRLEVFNAKGSQLIDIQGTSGSLPQYLARQTQALPKGVYIVKMVVGNKLYTKQVVKQ